MRYSDSSDEWMTCQKDTNTRQNEYGTRQGGAAWEHFATSTTTGG